MIHRVREWTNGCQGKDGKKRWGVWMDLCTAIFKNGKATRTSGIPQGTLPNAMWQLGWGVWEEWKNMYMAESFHCQLKLSQYFYSISPIEIKTLSKKKELLSFIDIPLKNSKVFSEWDKKGEVKLDYQNNCQFVLQ